MTLVPELLGDSCPPSPMKGPECWGWLALPCLLRQSGPCRSWKSCPVLPWALGFWEPGPTSAVLDAWRPGLAERRGPWFTWTPVPGGVGLRVLSQPVCARSWPLLSSAPLLSVSSVSTSPLFPGPPGFQLAPRHASVSGAEAGAAVSSVLRGPSLCGAGGCLAPRPPGLWIAKP